MIRIKNCLAVSCFIFCLCLISSSLCFAENLPEQKLIDNTDSVSTPQKQDNPQAGNISDKSAENSITPPKQTSKERKTEEEQDLMEKALDLLEVADIFWEKGDIENTLNTLDKAYALVLDTNGDVDIARQKDDLRLLISKRILSVYSAKQTVTNGKASEIPLIMNADVEKEIRSFQGIERDFFISSYQRSGLYRSIILKELKKAGIPEELFWLPLVESGFKIQAYSRARALGLWQFIPSTGYKFGLSRDEWVDERMDVEKSTLAAIAYLKELHNMFGDWLTVLAAYNCGEGRVLRVISRQHINYFDGFWDLYHQLPQETARYVPRFLATLHIIKNPQKYGINLDNAIEKPIPFSTVKVNKVMKIHDIATKLEVSEDVMNLLNSELRYKITPDTEYELKIPTEALTKFNIVANEIPESEKPRFAGRTVFTGRTVFIKHRVKSGETVTSIAKRYKVSPSNIVSYNKKSTKKGLVVGQKLDIPIFRGARLAKNKPRSKNQRTQAASVDGRKLYKVKKGDTLLNIAKRSDISPAQIKEINNLNSNSIQIGQIIKLSKPETVNSSERKNEENKSSMKIGKKVKIVNQTLSAADMDKLGTNKYIVTKGDNLHIIALKNNSSSAKLMQLNNLSGNETLKPGRVLIIK
jgi:membrane-bound lytic murein transglycosylase D